MSILDRSHPNGVVWLESELISSSKEVKHGFSTRIGGVSQGCFSSLNLGHTRGDDLSAVRENYRRFLEAADAGRVGDMVLSHQVHLDHIRLCSDADRGKGLDRERDYDADGLMTDTVGLPLVVFSADCIPILFHDPVHHAIAACHAGWRGTAMGIAGKTVQRMQETFGTRPGDIRAAIGPGISACCFLTHEDVVDGMRSGLGTLADPYIKPVENGERFSVDLKAINRAVLKQAGVNQIEMSTDCTACDLNKYWSHRKIGAARGSMAAVIMLKEPL